MPANHPHFNPQNSNINPIAINWNQNQLFLLLISKSTFLYCKKNSFGVYYLDKIHEFKHSNGYLLSTNKIKLDVNFIHDFMTHSYWARGIAKEKVKTTIDNTLCFGLYIKDKQIGFTNVITDFSRFAYLCNVYITEEYRGNGLAQWMLDKIFNLEELQVKRWMLGTKDMHPLYRKFGFNSLADPDRMMEYRPKQ